MDIYFVLWAPIQYYFIYLLKLFWLCPLGALVVGCCIPLKYPQQWLYFVLLSTSLRSDLSGCARLILCISCSRLSITHFSQ